MGWETVVLHGGPADGLRIRVRDRPPVLQVVRHCPVEAVEDGGEDGAGSVTEVQALYVYRRAAGQPPRYGFDPASP